MSEQLQSAVPETVVWDPVQAELIGHDAHGFLLDAEKHDAQVAKLTEWIAFIFKDSAEKREQNPNYDRSYDGYAVMKARGAQGAAVRKADKARGRAEHIMARSEPRSTLSRFFISSDYEKKLGLETKD